MPNVTQGFNPQGSGQPCRQRLPVTVHIRCDCPQWKCVGNAWMCYWSFALWLITLTLTMDCLSFKILCLFSFYLKEIKGVREWENKRESERESKRRDPFSISRLSFGAGSSRSQEPGASSKSSTWAAGILAPGPSSAASRGTCPQKSEFEAAEPRFVAQAGAQHLSLVPFLHASN